MRGSEMHGVRRYWCYGGELGVVCCDVVCSEGT